MSAPDLSEEATEAFNSAAMKLFPRDLQGAQGVLIEQRKADSWSVCSYCDCGLDVRPIREIGGQLHACCPHDVAKDELLEPDDLRRFSIGFERLARAPAASAALAAVVTQITDFFWLLARLPCGRCLAPGADVYSLEAARANLVLWSAKGSAPAMAITSDIDAEPELRLCQSGVEPSPFTACIAVHEGEAAHLAAGRISLRIGTPRLVLSRSQHSSILDGRRLDLSPQMFALFLMLAEQAH